MARPRKKVPATVDTVFNNMLRRTGLTYSELARTLDVSIQTVRRWAETDVILSSEVRRKLREAATKYPNFLTPEEFDMLDRRAGEYLMEVRERKRQARRGSSTLVAMAR